MVLRLAGPLGCVLRVGTCAVVAVGVAPIGIGGGLLDVELEASRPLGWVGARLGDDEMVGWRAQAE